MKPLTTIFLGCLLMAFARSSPAAESQPPPIRATLQLIYVSEEQQMEFVFVIGQAGFKSVASLKRYLGSWPPGSELSWAPGCRRWGGEPLLSSDEEMQAFREFLAEKGIRFVLVPSG